MEWRHLVHPAPEGGAQGANFRTGDEVRVWYRILEQGKERLASFEGIVIRRRGAGAEKSFTVRRVTFGEGVERVFPCDSKAVARIEVVRRGRVKRSRLYYLRDVIGKTRVESADQAAEGNPPTT